MHATNRPLPGERFGAGDSKWRSWRSVFTGLLTILGCLQGAIPQRLAADDPNFAQVASLGGVETASATATAQTKEAQGTAASTYQWPYPPAASKKGLQVELVDDALELGIQHAGLNLNLSQLVNPSPSSSEAAGPQVEIDGRVFHFHRSYLEGLDRQIKTLSDAGVLVNVIVLTYLSGDPSVSALMIHPDCVAEPPNRLGAFNNRTADGRAWLTASLQFLAERWSRTDQQFGRVVGWIVGNEVNSHWWWANMGPVTMEAFSEDYEQVVRLMHTAIRSQSASSRVYVSLEHHWNIRYPAGDETQAFAARGFLEHFSTLVRQRGDFDWHVAFHPYPENLFDAAFWEDSTATEDDGTQRITPRNLPVLERFLARPEMQFAGQPRRVILSEQGFHSAPTAESELTQAAAYCYAYRLIEAMPTIDAFILHRHIDHPHEGGLNLGLRRRAAAGEGVEQRYPKKPIWDCFYAADRDNWQEVFEFALPEVGLREWPE